MRWSRFGSMRGIQRNFYIGAARSEYFAEGIAFYRCNIQLGDSAVFKQICFFRKRPDMTMEEFMDYYENQHSQLSKRMGKGPSIPNAVRYVRRYLKPEKNPVTGEVIDPGFDCIMEIWWNSRADFENSQKIISSPDRLPFIKEDERKLFASHSNPVCSVEEYDSPMGPNGEMTHVELKYAD